MWAQGGYHLHDQRIYKLQPLDGKRRVRSLTFHTELDHLVELLRHPHLQPVLKEEHVKAVEEPDTTRSLALEV